MGAIPFRSLPQHVGGRQRLAMRLPELVSSDDCTSFHLFEVSESIAGLRLRLKRFV